MTISLMNFFYVFILFFTTKRKHWKWPDDMKQTAPFPLHWPKSPPTIQSTSAQAPTSSRLFSPRNLLTTRTDHPIQKDITILAISDTHSLHGEITNPLPRTKGDIFIHAGDLTADGTEEELEDSLKWIQDVTKHFKFVFYIGGNHDIALTKPEVVERITKKYPKLIFLENTLTEITVKGRKLRIYGSSKSPRHSKKSYAFTYERNTTEDVWGWWCDASHQEGQGEQGPAWEWQCGHCHRVMHHRGQASKAVCSKQ